MYQALFDEIVALSDQYFYGGNLDRAVELLRHGVEIAEHEDVSVELKFDMNYAYGDKLTRQAGVQTGDFDAALKIAQYTQELAENDVQKGKSFNLLGSVYYQHSLNSTERDFSKPRAAFQQAYDLLQGTDDMQALFWPTLRIGLTHQFTNEHDEALKFFRDAESIARENNLELELSFAVRHVGFILQNQDKLQEALEAHIESLELRDKLGFKVFLSMPYVAVASVYESLKDNDNALKYYEDGRKIAAAVGLARPQLIVLLNYGMLLIESGRKEEGRKMLVEANVFAEAVGHEQAKKMIAEKLGEE